MLKGRDLDGLRKREADVAASERHQGVPMGGLGCAAETGRSNLGRKGRRLRRVPRDGRRGGGVVRGGRRGRRGDEGPGAEGLDGGSAQVILHAGAPHRPVGSRAIRTEDQGPLAGACKNNLIGVARPLSHGEQHPEIQQHSYTATSYTATSDQLHSDKRPATSNQLHSNQRPATQQPATSCADEPSGLEGTHSAPVCSGAQDRCADGPGR